MSMKNLGSKLASGVHKVKLKHEKETPATPIKTAPAVNLAVKPAAQKPETKSTPVSAVAKTVAPHTAQQTAEHLERLHPSRIWPD